MAGLLRLSRRLTIYLCEKGVVSHLPKILSARLHGLGVSWVSENMGLRTCQPALIIEADYLVLSFGGDVKGTTVIPHFRVLNYPDPTKLHATYALGFCS